MYKVDLQSTKPQKPKRLKKVFKFVLYSLLFVFFFLGFFAVDYFFFSGAELLNRSSVLKAISTGSSILNKVIDTELKHDDYVTSALIVGIDTRNVIFENGEFRSTSPKGQAGTRNTDTIIQAVYDHNDETLTFISIPRDLGVDFDEECLEFHGSIHWVYDKTQTAKCPGGGVQGLTQAVESVTGIEVQYYAFITLESFVEAIETVGEVNSATGEKGIYVDNPENVWDVYPYNDHGWENVYFKKGRIFLSGEDALKYVRVRQLTSDFGRARRQQIVIEAVLARVLSTDTFLNPDKISDLYNIYQQKTLISPLSPNEMLAALEVLETFNLDNDVNIVLDPSLGGNEVYLNKQPHNRPGGPYYMVPTHWKDCPGNEFCRVQKLIQSIKKNPKVYSENAKVFAYATTFTAGKPNFSDIDFATLVDSDPAIFINKSQHRITVAENLKQLGKVVVIDFSNGKFPETKLFLEQQPGFTVVDGSEYQRYKLNKEDFAILVIH